MFVRTLLTCSLVMAPVIAQEQAPESAAEKKPDPRIQRFLAKRNFFARKAPAAVKTAEADPPKVCSIPLVNVTPPVRPYMPMIKPRVNTHSMTIAPPAPPCEDRREGPEARP